MIVFALVVGKGMLVGRGIINDATRDDVKVEDPSSYYPSSEIGEHIAEVPDERMEAFEEDNIETSEDFYRSRHLGAVKENRGGNIVRKEIQIIRVFVEDEEENIVLSDISPEEAAKAIDKYMEERETPLSGYGDTFIKVADKYGHDWRLLPAISLRESTGGKHLFKPFNPFGWGRSSFDGFDEAIETVGRHLAGLEPSTAGYYKDKTIWRKLRKYNSVVPEYPEEVFEIMRDIERGMRD